MPLNLPGTVCPPYSDVVTKDVLAGVYAISKNWGRIRGLTDRTKLFSLTDQMITQQLADVQVLRSFSIPIPKSLLVLWPWLPSGGRNLSYFSQSNCQFRVGGYSDIEAKATFGITSGPPQTMSVVVFPKARWRCSVAELNVHQIVRELKRKTFRENIVSDKNLGLPRSYYLHCPTDGRCENDFNVG